jgi:hypothetical protein
VSVGGPPASPPPTPTPKHAGRRPSARTGTTGLPNQSANTHTGWGGGPGGERTAAAAAAGAAASGARPEPPPIKEPMALHTTHIETAHRHGHD